MSLEQAFEEILERKFAEMRMRLREDFAEAIKSGPEPKEIFARELHLHRPMRWSNIQRNHSEAKDRFTKRIAGRVVLNLSDFDEWFAELRGTTNIQKSYGRLRPVDLTKISANAGTTAPDRRKAR